MKYSLDSSDISDTNLSGANFRYVDIEYCEFKNSNLNSTNFIGARVNTCDFRGADLGNSVLDRSTVINQLLRSSCYEFDKIDCNLTRVTIDYNTVSSIYNFLVHNYEFSNDKPGKQKMSQLQKLEFYQEIQKLGIIIT